LKTQNTPFNAKRYFIDDWQGMDWERNITLKLGLFLAQMIFLHFENRNLTDLSLKIFYFEFLTIPKGLISLWKKMIWSGEGTRWGDLLLF